MLRRLPAAVLTLSLVALTGCEIPRFEGAQIQSPPLGFLLQPENYQQHRMFPEKDATFHTSWVHTDVGGVSVIYLDGHAGEITLEEIMASRDMYMAAAIDPDRQFGDLEPLSIDGRSAWGWAERIYSTNRGLVEVTYRAVVPYDTISYAIAFVSSEPVWKSAAPDTLKAVISTFAIGETEWNLPLIAIAFGAVLFVGAQFRSRRQAKADRLRSINLVTVEQKQEEEKQREEAAAAAFASAPAEAGPPPAAAPPPVSDPPVAAPPPKPASAPPPPPVYPRAATGE